MSKKQTDRKTGQSTESMDNYVQRHTRTALLLGEDAAGKLSNAHVAVVGVGGVGAAALECLARSGVGTLTLCDPDRVEESNLNRQLIATEEVLGLNKTDAADKRVKAVDSSINVYTKRERYEGGFPEWLEDADCVIDAIDDINAKTELICECITRGVRIYSAMGAALRTHPEYICVGDIFDTSCDPLARVMRRRLRESGITAHTVAYSREYPQKREDGLPLGSYACVPVAMGCALASLAIRYITETA